MKQRTILHFGCLGIFIAICGCSQQPQLIRESSADFCLNDALRERIRIDTLTERRVTQHVSLTGEITYNPDKVVRFASLVEGVAVETYFSLGDRVTAGQVLATVKSPELNALLAEQRTLKARRGLVERELAAARRMYENGIAAERDLLEAQSESDRLTAQLANMASSLALFHPDEASGTFEIRAPAAGYIVEKAVNAGAPFHGGEILFTLSALNEVWALVNIYATDMPFVEPGMEVGIQTLAYPNEVFRGRIAALSQVFDSDERVLKARVVLQNAGLRLKPGMLADISVERRTGQQAVAIPGPAVIFDDNQYFAVVYENDCRLRVQRLVLLAKDDDWYFIEEGLNAGEQVVTQNHLLLYETVKTQP